MTETYEYDESLTQVENAVNRLRAENKRLKEWKEDVENSHRIVMEEKCASDEIHCGCVPSLRREIERLREALASLWGLSCLYGEREGCMCNGCIVRRALDPPEEEELDG